MKHKILIVPLAIIFVLSASVLFVSAQNQPQQYQEKEAMQSYDFKDNPKNLKIDRDQAWDKADEFYDGNGDLTDIELEEENGRPVWKIDVEQKYMDYEIMVDADSGEVIGVNES